MSTLVITYARTEGIEGSDRRISREVSRLSPDEHAELFESDGYTLREYGVGRGGEFTAHGKPDEDGVKALVSLLRISDKAVKAAESGDFQLAEAEVTASSFQISAPLSVKASSHPHSLVTTTSGSPGSLSDGQGLARMSAHDLAYGLLQQGNWTVQKLRRGAEYTAVSTSSDTSFHYSYRIVPITAAPETVTEALAELAAELADEDF